MFSAEDIQQRLRARPFRPLRIVASEGLTYDIYHPDLVFVGRHYLMIGSPDPTTPSIYDRITYVSMVHIVALEELPVVAATSTNGPSS
jgi:hypothetical protein